MHVNNSYCGLRGNAILHFINFICLNKWNIFLDKLLVKFRLRCMQQSSSLWTFSWGEICDFLQGQWKAICSDSSSAATKTWVFLIKCVIGTEVGFACGQPLKYIYGWWEQHMLFICQLQIGHLRPSRKNLVSCIAGHSINAGQICCMISACCDCICGSYSSWQDCMFSSNFSVISV